MAVGIKTAYVKIGDQVIELDHSYLGVAKADIKGLSGNLTNISGSNEIQYTYAETEKPTVSLTINRAGSALIAKLTGKQKVGKGSLYVNGNKLPLVGLAIVSPEIGGDSDHMWVFPRCRASVQSISLSTNTDSKKNVVYDQITFNANAVPEFGGKCSADGTITVDGAVEELKALGWAEPTENSGDFKDDASTTGPAISTGDH